MTDKPKKLGTEPYKGVRDFFPADGGANHFRLNFSNSTPERIREGVRRLGALIRSL